MVSAAPAPGVERSAFEQVLGNIKTYEITTLARCEHGLAASSPSTQGGFLDTRPLVSSKPMNPFFPFHPYQ